LNTERRELIPILFLTIYLISGFILFVAVNTGYYYSILYTPYCLFSWNCILEPFTSIVTYSSIVVLVVDAVFAYLFLTLLVKNTSLSLKTIIGVYLAGSLILLFSESLFLISVNSVKKIILGASSGGILALGFLAVYLELNTKYLIISVRKQRYITIQRTLLLFILYLVVRLILSTMYTTSKFDYAPVGLLISGPVGYVIGATRLKKKVEYLVFRRIGLVFTALAIVLLSVLLVYSIGYTWRNYQNTTLYYVSKECDIEYSVLKGYFQGREVIKTEQKILIQPFDESDIRAESFKGRVHGECRVLYEQSRSYTYYSWIITLIIGVILLSTYIIALSKTTRSS